MGHIRRQSEFVACDKCIYFTTLESEITNLALCRIRSSPCRSARWFTYDLVTNPEDRFSRDQAHMMED